MKVATLVLVLLFTGTAFANSNLIALQPGHSNNLFGAPYDTYRVVDLDGNPLLHPVDDYVAGRPAVLLLGFRQGVVGQFLAALSIGNVAIFTNGFAGGSGFPGIFSFYGLPSGNGHFTVLFGDGSAYSADFRYNASGGLTSVPEPSTLALVGTGIAFFVRRRLA